MLYYYKHLFVPLDRTLELYFTGCTLHCQGCQNYFLQDRRSSYTREVTPDDIMSELSEYPEIALSTHILGGEPLEQPEQDMIELLRKLRQAGFKNIIFFTGYDLTEEGIRRRSELFRNVDWIKTGRYDNTQLNIRNKKEENTPFALATLNQRFIKR